MPPLTEPSMDPELREKVESHLAQVLEGEDLATALFATALAVQDAEAEVEIGTQQPGTLRKDRAAEHEHFTAMADHVNGLRRLLRGRRPLFDIYRINGVQTPFDWSAFDRALEALATSARAHVEATAPPKIRRRPPINWRDNLISVLFSVHPSREEQDAHFTSLVTMVLDAIDPGGRPSKIHQVIAGALRRNPEPPFVVSGKDKSRIVDQD
jgi:hypothetical protein